VSYSVKEIKAYLRAEAIKVCEELSPIAVEVGIIDALRNVKVFVKCIDVELEKFNASKSKDLNTSQK